MRQGDTKQTICDICQYRIKSVFCKGYRVFSLFSYQFRDHWETESHGLENCVAQLVLRIRHLETTNDIVEAHKLNLD